MNVPVLYELNNDGEATGQTRRFCSHACQEKYLIAELYGLGRVHFGNGVEEPNEGEQCAQCGEVLKPEQPVPADVLLPRLKPYGRFPSNMTFMDRSLAIRSPYTTLTREQYFALAADRCDVFVDTETGVLYTHGGLEGCEHLMRVKPEVKSKLVGIIAGANQS